MRMLSAMAVTLLLSGCVTDGSDGAWGGWFTFGVGPNPVWYDGYYGAYPGGYWGVDGIFVYSDRSGHYHRDDDGHFRHERFGRAREYRPRTPPRDKPNDARR